MLDAAYQVSDLRVPPGNRLEKLKEVGRVSGASGLICNGGYALLGTNTVLKGLNLMTTINEQEIFADEVPDLTANVG